MKLIFVEVIIPTFNFVGQDIVLASFRALVNKKLEIEILLLMEHFFSFTI